VKTRGNPWAPWGFKPGPTSDGAATLKVWNHDEPETGGAVSTAAWQRLGGIG